MKEIKRIHAEPKYQSEHGDYVLHSDHEAEVARLRAEVERLRFAASEVADFLVCLPGMSKNDVEIVASRLVERIDAAIGASA